MSLADDIRAYIESKDEEGHNKVKKEFFADILDKLRTGSLSVDYLNEKIAALKTNRALLFYKRMRGKPAISSQAAQLVARIYETYLGIPIHDLSLAIIVAEGISKTNALKISRYPYEAWLKYPFSVAKQVYLNRQLLSDLKLPIPAETNVYILSTALKKELDKQNINLSTSCLTVLQRAPDYLPILINQLFSQYKSEDRADEFAEHLTNQMLVLIQDKDPALIERNQQLIHALSQVDVAILAKLTAAHPLFFLSLNSPSQKEVLNSFSPAETRELERYLNEYLREDPVVATHQLSSISDFLAKEGEAAQSSSMILISLRERVKERLGERAELFIHREQATKALNAIESYLLLNPNAYKDEIFYELGLEIKRKGQITVEMLENALKAADRHKLFAKWSGPTRSRAAQLMTQLFTIATLGEVLLPQDQQRMILTGSLPHVDTLADKFDNAVTERIETVLVKPETAQESWLGRIIESELSVYKSVANVAKYNLGKNHQRAEAIYQQFLITKGIAIAEKQTQPIFDTQGHILIEVSLTQEDMDELITIISEGNETRGSLEKLAEAMGVGALPARHSAIWISVLMKVCMQNSCMRLVHQRTRK